MGDDTGSFVVRAKVFVDGEMMATGELAGFTPSGICMYNGGTHVAPIPFGPNKGEFMWESGCLGKKEDIGKQIHFYFSPTASGDSLPIAETTTFIPDKSVGNLFRGLFKMTATLPDPVPMPSPAASSQAD
jgi:hypothetical protein